MQNIWAIIKIIPEYRGRLAAIFAGSAIVGLAGTATPYIFRAIVNIVVGVGAHRLTRAQAVHGAIIAMLVFVGLRLVILVTNHFLEKQSDSLWLNTVSTLRQRVFDQMTGLSLDFYERTRAGDIMERFGTITTITQWLFQLSEGVLASMLQLGFGTAVLLYKAPVAGLIMLVLIPVNLVASFREIRQTKPLRRRWNQLVGKLSGLLSEMVSQIATVRSFAGERAIKQQYDAVQKDWWATRTVEQAIQHRSGLVINLANMVGACGCVIFITLGALSGRYTVGDILLVLTLTNTLITTLQPITRLVNNTGDVDASAERLVELLKVPGTIRDMPDAQDVAAIESIEFRAVNFAYPGKDEAALSDISFRVRQGEQLALVGQSGSGKSTIIKLLMRFYEPQSGQILINGRDIRAYRQDSLRGQFGAVLQDVALFNETIANNIRFSRPGASQDEVRAAAQRAHADVFIDSFPNGYDTVVGERGVRLSGGEKQRVAIARALLRDPTLVILDEATSALDSASEKLVQDGLQTLMAGKTAIVIAHRLSTIAKADKILVLQNGRIVESGSHASLVHESRGLYARLHALQSAAPTMVA